MLKPIRLLSLFALLVLLSAAVSAQAAPLAVRVRVAHLAPFAGSSAAKLTVTLDGAPLAANLVYGDRTDYQPLAVEPGEHTIVVARDGAPVLSAPVTLIEGDQSILIIGDENKVPLAVWPLDDTGPDPSPGAGQLRVAHAAALGATIAETEIDVCSQTGGLFDNSAAGLRYRRTSFYHQLPPAAYNLKITRYAANTPCGGPTLFSLAPVSLPEGARLTLILVGDGNHQPYGGFTFADGLLDGESPPVSNRIYLPAALR